MVVALHVVEVDASEVAGIDGGVAPEEEATASTIPVADDGCCSQHVVRHAPHVAFRHALEVAQPEEHAERVDDVGRGNAGEGHELSRGVLLVQPQPGRSLVVVAVLDEFLRRSIDGEEADGRLTDAQRGARGQRGALVVAGREGHFPGVARLYVLDGVAGLGAGQRLADGALAVGGGEDNLLCVGSLVPLHEGVVAASLVDLRHLHAADARGTFAHVLLHDTRGEVLPVGELEDVFEGYVRGHVLLRVGSSADDLRTGERTVAVDGDLHGGLLSGPCEDVVVALQLTADLGCVRSLQLHAFALDVLVLAGGEGCCDTATHQTCKRYILDKLGNHNCQLLIMNY